MRLLRQQNQTEIIETPGRDALWLWFQLSYAAYLTIPRVLMHDMPDEWQGKMAELLNEYSEAYPNWPDIGSRVLVTDARGKLIHTPDWLLNYRHPNRTAIDELKKKRDYGQKQS
jgi:hypothetical protein